MNFRTLSNMFMNVKSVAILFFMIMVYGCNYSQNQDPSSIEIEEESELHKTFLESEVLDQLLIEDSIKKRSTDHFSSIVLFEDTLKALYKEIEAEDYQLDFKVFRYAMIGYYNLKQEGRLLKDNLITIIDYTKSSCDKRFYTIDLVNKQFIFHTYVAHGRNTGADKAAKFSDKPQSYQSSIGFYLTGESYTGSKGYSMRLDGDEVGYNANMRKRAIVMHNANYVSKDFIKKYGRLGRSLGCPSLPKGISKEVINTIKNRSAVFAYYNDEKYIKASKYLDLDKLVNRLGLEVEEE